MGVVAAAVDPHGEVEGRGHVRQPQPPEPGYCIHELPEGTCSDGRCRPDGKTLQLEHGPGGLPPEPVAVTAMWAARWGGECGNCGNGFEVDTTIGRAAEQGDMPSPYVCRGCCGPVAG